MEILAKRFLLFVFVSSVPMQLITAAWFFTVGRFSWIEAIHSNPYCMLTGFCILFAFLVAMLIPDYDLKYK